MRKILPVILALIGVGAGVGAGIMLKPAPVAPVEASACVPPQADAEHSASADAPMPHGETPASGGEKKFDYVKLNNQFVIPVVKKGNVTALVVLSLSLEISPGDNEKVFRKEPKLRDAFLQVLFDHANSGGFDGAFTQSSNMAALRSALLEVAR